PRGRHPARPPPRANAPISRGKCLRRGDHTTAPFIKKRRHCQKPLSDGLDIDHHHHIWYDHWVVNPCLTLSKVDSLISGRTLRCWCPHRACSTPGRLPLWQNHSRSVDSSIITTREAISQG